MSSTNSKDDFIKQLTSMTKEEIDNFIKQNGKPKKMVNLFEHIHNKESN